MKTAALLKNTALTLAVFTLIGCGGNGTSTNKMSMASITPLGTTENSKLILKIEDSKKTIETNTTNISNSAPIAVATANGHEKFISTTVGEPVFFNSNNSFDSDGEIAGTLWTDMDHNILSSDSNFTRVFYYSGIYEKTLTVADNKGAVSNDHICILVDITKDDIPMIANAGPDIETIPDTNITLEGRVICRDGNYTYSWSEDDEILANTKSFTKTYNKGTHTIVLEITDNQSGYKAWDTVDITVKQPEN